MPTEVAVEGDDAAEQVAPPGDGSVDVLREQVDVEDVLHAAQLAWKPSVAWVPSQNGLLAE